uniref:FBD domain-containing protein n=1 Tax=Leersia perrieri TaxID=77586 RepID=A0A0D9XQ92_9ORYZ
MVWFMYALMCQVQVLIINNSMCTRIEMDDGFSLVSWHLTELDLSGLVFNKCFLDFSSCPALEHIHFSARCCFVSVKKILSQSVKYVSFDYPEFSEHHRTHIYAPNLITLHLDDCWGRHLSDPTRIVMTGVIRLTLATVKMKTAMVVMRIFRSDLRWCPLFSKSKYLLLNEWCVAFNFWALACIMEHSPVLVKLILQISKETAPMINTVENGNALVKPAAISKHLKVVKVHCKEVDEGVCKIVKFLSTLGIQVIIKRTDRSAKLSRIGIQVEVLMKAPLDEVLKFGLKS